MTDKLNAEALRGLIAGLRALSDEAYHCFNCGEDHTALKSRAALKGNDDE